MMQEFTFQIYVWDHSRVAFVLAYNCIDQAHLCDILGDMLEDGPFTPYIITRVDQGFPVSGLVELESP